MMEQGATVLQAVQIRDELLKKQAELYVLAVEQLNMRTRDLLRNDFGHTLLINAGHDIAGEIAHRFFDLGDFYITVDQLFDRILHFTYENDNDIFSADESIRKAFYNIEDSPHHSKELQRIAKETAAAQKQLFTEERASDKLDKQGKAAYRQKQMQQRGKLVDELTGQDDVTGTYTRNGRQVPKSSLQADHVQAREAARYNSNYLHDENIDALKRFYNSGDNMEMIHGSANSSKSDIRVCKIDGQILYLSTKSNEYKAALEQDSQMDITYKATPEQLVNAVVHQWETKNSESEGKGNSKIETLKEKGYLDENGKVKDSVKNELKRKIIHSQNTESVVLLQNMDYQAIGSDAMHKTKRSLPKIMAGQLLYYGMPPLVFEAQQIIRTKNITFDLFISKMKQAGNRIIQYIKSKIGAILKSIAHNVFTKFLKNFFDIIIETLKATVKRIVQAAKQIIMSLVNCVKSISNKNMSTAQKADAVTKSLSVVVGSIVLEILFEYMEAQFGLPDWLMEPLQIIVTILATNSIMLILQKMDLFNVQYGLLLGNIERVFNETNTQYIAASDASLISGKEEIEHLMNELKEQIQDVTASIDQLDFYRDSVQPELQQMNEMFAMGINFDFEWAEFVSA